MLKRTGGSLLIDGHFADGIDRPIGGLRVVCTPGAVYLLLVIFFHAMPASSLRDSSHVPAKFPKCQPGQQGNTLNLRGMTFAETNPQSCFQPKSGEDGVKFTRLGPLDMAAQVRNRKR